MQLKKYLYSGDRDFMAGTGILWRGQGFYDRDRDFMTVTGIGAGGESISGDRDRVR